MLAYIKLLRPYQWIKNLFVFTGILFSHRWGEAALWYQVVLAAAAFSLVSSGIYALNDIADREQDRLHPRKCRRPVACGAVSVPMAWATGLGVLATGLVLANWASPMAFGLIALYAILNGAYSVSLKHVVVLDIFIIAAGFMLRILVGTLGVGIAPSRWLLLCGFMVTLFLGSAKRRAELMDSVAGGGEHRKVLEHYSPALLDLILGVTATASILTYGLYTMSADTVALQGTPNLIYTVPLVIYGLFRYLYLLYANGGGGDPSIDLMRDPHLLVTLMLWVGLTFSLVR